MAWDTEGTKRKILVAAVVEFAKRGPDGTTVEQIARRAGVNKERIYNYYGDKKSLFTLVLREELAKAAREVAIESLAAEDIGEYAGRAYDYHRHHPALNRLLRWEGLVIGGEVPDEAGRRDFYADKVAAIARGQQENQLTRTIAADHLAFLILSLAGWWSAMPQVARMFSGADDEEEHARRRASVVIAARRLAMVNPD